MAIALSSKTNVDNTDPDFPFGKIKNDSGIGDGTPVSEEVYQDFHQFFAKLLDESGFSPNGVHDNDSNGYQYFDALMQVLYTAQVTGLAVNYAGTYQPDGTSPIAFRRGGSTQIRIKGKVDNSAPGFVLANDPVFTLPPGYCPAQTQLFACATSDVTQPIAIVQVTPAGVVSLRGDLLSVDNTKVYINISFDND